MSFNADEEGILPVEVAAAYANFRASEALEKIAFEFERLNDLICEIDWPQPAKE